jgi:hypothetical protein
MTDLARLYPNGVRSILALILLAALVPGSGLAKPQIRTSFFGAYPNAVDSRLDNLPSHPGHCGVCHYDFNGAGPKNFYGNRLQAVLGGFPNNDAGRQQAMHSIEGEDNDGDGFTTLTEITNTTLYSNTPTFPGLTASNVGQCSNIPNLTELTGYLVPVTGADVTPPGVTVTSPNGGESWVGGEARTITWTATDDVGVVAVDVYYRDSETAAWTKIAKDLPHTGSFQWFVHNVPTPAARVRVVAYDAAANAGSDQSNGLFTLVRTPGGIAPTTLRDFHQPGSQPFEGGVFEDASYCANCHGGYDSAVEPAHNFMGSMMSQAAHDPLFYACLAIAEQDAPSSGDLCLRCHTPFGWLSGRSQPTSGSQLIPLDRSGVACDFCHRMVDPIYQPGVSPIEDQALLDAMLPAHVPTGYSNGQYVMDPQGRKRGPFADAVAPHSFLESSFTRTSEFCGTCHDVSNPVFVRVAGADYAPGPLDQPADAIDSEVLLPLERTYSEWKHSAFPAGVYAPDFAGNKPDGIVSSCQDCHMRDVQGAGCNEPLAPVRANLPLHDMTGGSSWMPPLLAALYPSETDFTQLAAGGARATATLQKAAVVGVTVAPTEDGYRASVTVTNRTGHKLPTGYPEGRRMWLNVVARDADGDIVYESGAYDPATGVLTEDPDAMIYDIHLGISPGLAAALGTASGTSFHFALNDSVYKDNRIPPLGFTNAAFAAFGGAHVDPTRPSPRYPDGQNWDVSEFDLPASARSVVARLYYQSTSKDYVEFLRDQNTSNAAGQTMYNLWAGNGRSTPVAMASDSLSFGPLDAPGGEPAALALSPLRNPFGGALELRLDLVSASRVELEIYDVGGRRISRSAPAWLGGGAHRLLWDGRDTDGRDAGAGTFWAVTRVDDRTLVKKVVRLR